ncbi:hypothetical protein B0H12DRAFT_1133479 [Mycena haematopus]|nr:hypothetical protein B0H12DRAFT_1133479 [Mycena haematopus]
MAYYKVRASGQRLLLLFGGQVNGLDPEALGEVSNEMIAIDVDHLKWWVIDVAGGPVTARVEAGLIIVGCVNEQLQTTESYSIASVGNNNWTWNVRDEPYPSHVPALGFCCDAIAVKDGVPRRSSSLLVALIALERWI